MPETFLETVDLSEEKLKKRIGRGRITTHISLFSGCGGLDLGFSKAGIQTLAMVEFAHEACETLRANWHWEELKKRRRYLWEDSDGLLHKDFKEGRKRVDGGPLWRSKEDLLRKANGYRSKKDKVDKAEETNTHVHTCSGVETWYHEVEPIIFERDIRTLPTKEILDATGLKVGECSIISGGFPCQGFSLAGKRVVADPRNSLYKEFVRIVDEAKPASIFGENVPGLVSMAQGAIIQSICEEFANCGYDIAWDILNAANYGVPQLRKRIILIGQRVDATCLREDGSVAYHIAACPGTITHPYLFYERLKRWSKMKNKDVSERALDVLKRIEENPDWSFAEKKVSSQKEDNY